MNDDVQELFREMDALADHLFAGMARDFGSAIVMPHNYRAVTPDYYYQPEQREQPDTIPPLPVSEPLSEVHRIENEVMVIADVPGATRESVHLVVIGNELIMDAGSVDRQYHTIVALPPFDPDSMQTSLKNGVLEVKFKCAGSSGIA